MNIKGKNFSSLNFAECWPQVEKCDALLINDLQNDFPNGKKKNVGSLGRLAGSSVSQDSSASALLTFGTR
jgi:hypothetical protein